MALEPCMWVLAYSAGPWTFRNLEYQGLRFVWPLILVWVARLAASASANIPLQVVGARRRLVHCTAVVF
jgi:hypothetical protein